MGLVDEIWKKITDINLTTVETPTHLQIPKHLIPKLLQEFAEVKHAARMDILMEMGGLATTQSNKATLLDIEDHFALQVTVSLKDTDEIKVLKEIKTNNQ